LPLLVPPALAIGGDSWCLFLRSRPCPACRVHRVPVFSIRLQFLYESAHQSIPDGMARSPFWLCLTTGHIMLERCFVLPSYQLASLDAQNRYTNRFGTHGTVKPSTTTE